MGFNIKQHLSSDFKVAVVLHAILGIAVPLMMLFLVGCDRLLLEEDPTVGPEASEKSVMDKIDELTMYHTPDLLVAGASTYFEQNIRVETSPVTKLQEVYTVVLERQTENEGYDTLLIQENSVDHTEENPVVVEKTLDWDVSKLPTSSSSKVFSMKPIAAFMSPLAHFGELSKSVVEALNEPVRSSYHDLKVKTYKTQLNSGCTNHPTCNLTVNEFKVSLVSWYADNSFDKTDITFQFSPDIPRLHRLIPPDSDPLGQLTGAALSFCQAGKVRDQGTSYFVNSCWILREFRF